MKQTLFLLAALSIASSVRAESAGGIQWTAPPGWKAEAPRAMRAATYRVPAAPGDKEDGECGVFYFGPGQGGSVDDNIQRWTGQFQTNAKPQIRKQTINGVPVTTIDLSGAYLAGGAAKPGYRLLGAIAEAPQGGVFFKFTGPAQTVGGHQAAFQKMIQSIRR